jgi:hypothetical protein
MSQTSYDLARMVLQQQTGPSATAGPPEEALPGVTAPQRSTLGAVLRFFVWTMLIALSLFAAVALTALWMVSDTARDIFNLDTNVTVISGQAVVDSINRVNKQVFIEHYNTVDIDYHEAPDGWLRYLPIEQSFVVLLKGRVPAGFDLSQLEADDVWVSRDGRRAQLVLPPPMIFDDNVNVDFEHSRILTQHDTCPEFICQDELPAFQRQMLPQGRALLIEAAERSGILAQTAIDGQRYYEQLLRSLGFEEVRVIVRGAEIGDED